MKHKIFHSLEEVQATIPVNKTKLIELNGQRICLAHTTSGLFAVDDTCPHLGESLSRGTVNYLREVVCPWHSYRFSLQNGTECKHRTKDLKTFVIEVTPDGVFLEL